MEIYPLGHSSFRIKGKDATVVTDPYDSAMVGIKFPKLDGVNIITISHDHGDHNMAANVSGAPFIVSGPGEYEISGVTIVGVATWHDDKEGSERGKNVVYNITIDGVHVCHLGDLGHKLTDPQLTAIGDVDILLVPIGGFYTIDPAMATQVVAQLEPKIVVPMHYFRPGVKVDVFGKLATVDKFLKEMGVENVVPAAKLATSKDRLPETTTMVVLE